MERLDKIIGFLKEIEKLKMVDRAIPLSNHSRKENSAEHSWHMGVYLIAFEKEFGEVDLLRLYKMVLVHDLVEIYTDDFCTYDKEHQEGKFEREKVAAEKLFGMLPDDLREEFYSLWEEFESGETKESKLAHGFDKIQATAQNVLTEGKCWKRWEATYQDIVDNKRKFYKSHEITNKIAEKLFEEIKARDLAWKE